MLLGLQQEFHVLQSDQFDPKTVRVANEVIDGHGACPDRGLLTSETKDRTLVRLKALPASGRVTAVWWRTRHAVTPAPACASGVPGLVGGEPPGGC
ncbi:hypothetical protein GCM10009826_40470 [Humibacillus xanthopallidus]